MGLKACLLLLVFVFMPLSIFAVDETLTVTTYYPSPYGSYNQFKVAADTWLAYSSGYVGIGTTAPSHKLAVRKGSAAGYGGPSQVQISHDGNEGMYLTSVDLNQNAIGFAAEFTGGESTDLWGTNTWTARYSKTWVLGNSGSDMLSMHVNSGLTSGNTFTPTAVMTWKDSGNVGIGTTGPAARLDIQGAADPFTAIRMGSSSTTQYANLIWYADTGNAQIWRSGSAYTTYGGASALNIYNGGAISFHPGGTQNAVYFNTAGKVGIGTTNPSVPLEVNGAVKVGGSETGTAASDIKAYIQKVVCENRRGVWVDETGCQEYAYFTPTAGAWGTVGCAAAHHVCTFLDLFSGGFASLRRPGYNAGTTYIWIGGTYSSAQERVFYPWGYGTDLTCAAGTHYMVDFRRAALGNTAWGCYTDSYVNVVACCRDSQ